ncbi:choline ABC transporter substrate-binding protein [Marinobacter bohaiensis]|uniref:choline ABC transporter substrate-binding protein n=1 Tax=Marinobacter bohaiensis TaxID=2201898 RepID=UPI000DAC3B5C|nr:choline ABC transporter substrate-binding protein [Marinobacter bohaiensis]
MTNSPKRLTTFLLAGVCAAATSAQAAVPEQCRTVQFSDPGWTDINVTNAITTTLLQGLGYDTQVDLLSVPIGFKSLKSEDVDVFLGNWMPAQDNFAKQYEGGYEKVRANLEGAKFTLAVPAYVKEQTGVSSFADLDEHAEAFDHRIYGIEPGAAGNNLIQKMIDEDAYGLGDWKLVESSEQGMLSQVSRAERRDKPVVFLAWEPHPMNLGRDLVYLSGADDYFGPNYGGATVYTLTRNGYSDECANVGQLLGNLQFTLDMESGIMGAVLNDGEDAGDAASAYLKSNPGVLTEWLDGVTTVDGQPGLPAVRDSLGL